MYIIINDHVVSALTLPSFIFFFCQCNSFFLFSALDDGFLLDLDPISSSSTGGAAAAMSTTGWGGLLFIDV